ncbi:MAG: FAD-dependent monooxygenase [Trueperaceae bacterium]
MGAGIGGLAAAIALARQGWSVDVYERAPSIEMVGAGLSLWRNALTALDAIGLGDAVRETSVPGPAAMLRTADGAPLSDLGQKRAAEEAGAPALSVVMHRADLQRVLLEGAERVGVRLHLGKTCVAFSEDARSNAADVASGGNAGVTVRFDDGGTAFGDLLVGADGIRSVVRGELHGHEAPRYAGYIAWRGVTRFDHARLLVGESWGHGQRFGQLPMRDGQVYWFAVANAPAGTVAVRKTAAGEAARPAEIDGAAEKVEVLRRFGNWHAPIRDLVEATDASAILRNDIADREPLTTWGRGRVTLLGDAAHPMTPNLGQGACQALEDAVVLARELARTQDVEVGLRAYEAERAPRTRAIVLRSRQMGAMGQWENPAAVTLRNAIMRILPAGMQQRQLAPILDWRP